MKTVKMTGDESWETVVGMGSRGFTGDGPIRIRVSPVPVEVDEVDIFEDGELLGTFPLETWEDGTVWAVVMGVPVGSQQAETTHQRSNADNGRVDLGVDEN